MPSEGLVIVENVSTINYLTTHKEMSVYNHEWPPKMKAVPVQTHFYD